MSTEPASTTAQPAVTDAPLVEILPTPDVENAGELSTDPFSNSDRFTSSEPFASMGSLREPREERFTLEWHDLKFDVETTDCSRSTETKTIINGTSGKFEPGQLTAIMGPSGAGKSTLMNVLAGRAPYGKISGGSIYMNGREADPAVYRHQLAYVMQSDALFATQTPREALEFTAALRLPHFTAEQREDRINGAITALGLEKCADTLIGGGMTPGLSGGEKKRAAVAVELISSPSLIFLDEPTSGLDSHSASELIVILRHLASTGCTIVCTIHQPSSEVFSLFHGVCYLKNGNTAYHGPVSESVAYFETPAIRCPQHTNAADFAILRLQKMTDDDVKALVAAKAKPLERVVSAGILKDSDVPQLDHAGFVPQLGRLFQREFRNLIRDKVTMIARFGMSLMLSVMLGVVYWRVGREWGTDGDVSSMNVAINNHWGGLFFVGMKAMFLSMQPLLLAFPLERAAFIREYTAGTYGVSAYVMAKTMIDIPAALISTAMGMCVMYFMMGLNGNFLYLVLAECALAMVSASIALVLGTLTTRAETAVNLAPVIYVPQILFTGFLISMDQIPTWLRWLQWACPLKYGVALLTIAEFSSKHVQDDRESLIDELVNRAHINRDMWWFLAIMCAVMFVFFRALSIILLARRAKNFE